jgi:hypothetical protein
VRREEREEKERGQEGEKGEKRRESNLSIFSLPDKDFLIIGTRSKKFSIGRKANCFRGFFMKHEFGYYFRVSKISSGIPEYDGSEKGKGGGGGRWQGLREGEEERRGVGRETGLHKKREGEGGKREGGVG